MHQKIRIVKKPKIDLAGHLKRTQQQKILGFFVLPTIGILSILLLGGLFSLPWHWQLFLRWLVHGGDVYSIPQKLHQEISDLCYTADATGEVKNYQASPEIRYGLESFNCRLSGDGKSWIIEDIKGFASINEAHTGSQIGTEIAVFVVSMVGTDYSYKIETTIPVMPRKTELTQ